MFVADIATGRVYVLDADGRRLGRLAPLFDAPFAMVADGAATLYVADATGIAVLRPPYSSIALHVDAPGAVVAAEFGGGAFAAASASEIAIYKKGKSAPCAAVSSAAFGRTAFAAFDAGGNLFVDGTDASGNAVVGVVSGGCKAVAIEALSTPNRIGTPGPIDIDANDRIALDDGSTNTVYVYAQPANGMLGNPVQSTSFVAGDLAGFAFRDDMTYVWGADTGLGRVYDFAYPMGGPPVLTVGGIARPAAVALVPAVEPKPTRSRGGPKR